VSKECRIKTEPSGVGKMVSAGVGRLLWSCHRISIPSQLARLNRCRLCRPVRSGCLEAPYQSKGWRLRWLGDRHRSKTQCWPAPRESNWQPVRHHDEQGNAGSKHGSCLHFWARVRVSIWEVFAELLDRSSFAMSPSADSGPSVLDVW